MQKLVRSGTRTKYLKRASNGESAGVPQLDNRTVKVAQNQFVQEE